MTFPSQPEPERNAFTTDDRDSRPSLSTTQILVALLGVIALLAIGAYLLTESRVTSGDAEIVSPEDGARFPPGTVPVRIRVAGEQTPELWELSYRSPGSTEWTRIASGDSAVQPGQLGRGLHVLSASEPGSYELRLVFRESGEEEQMQTIVFEVGP
jgi:hypothetical protein